MTTLIRRLCLVLIAGLVVVSATRSGLQVPAQEQGAWLNSWQGTPSLEIHPPAPESTITIRRIAAKSEVARLVISGEMSLVQAAAWFRFLNSVPSSYPSHSWMDFPGDSDAEKICRQVIYWVPTILEDNSLGKIKALQQRLEEELARHIAENNGVVLPEL